jgi:signal peptidase I
MASIAFVIRISVLLVYKIENEFMAPALKGESILIGSKWAYGIRFPWSDSGYFTREPKVGDIVAIEYKNQPGLIFIKRIIAGPGDQVKIEKSHVYINQMKCNYLESSQSGILIEDCGQSRISIRNFSKEIYFSERKLSPGEYFTLYDNREFETESSQFSSVGFSQILGKIYFNF